MLECNSKSFLDHRTWSYCRFEWLGKAFCCAEYIVKTTFQTGKNAKTSMLFFSADVVKKLGEKPVVTNWLFAGYLGETV
jgi:hypothetical protein